MRSLPAVRSRSLHALLLLALFTPAAAAQIADPVRTADGPVAGVAAGLPGVRVFRGIPFAAPPVGELRWRPPAPVRGWTTVRQADAFGPGCTQQLARSRPPWTEEFMHQGEASEDCLYLNVWTAAAAPEERRPVLVYVHGGGFNEGSGSVAAYDGAALARRGPVVVTINYRLGVLGFLSHPELSAEAGRGSSGNYGLLDQIAALEWVRDNIAGFGGDPENVTLAGQSAGAISVYLLAASPLARGLFHRAIVQSGPGALASFGLSGTTGIARPLAAAESSGVAFAAGRGASSIAELRALPVSRLTAPPVAGAPSQRFGPVVDGFLLPADVATIYATGRQHDVPMIMGMNADEPSASADYGTVTVEEFRRSAATRYGAAASAFLALYPAATDAAAGVAQKTSMRDLALVAMGRVAEERTAAGDGRTYLYLLERAIPWPERPEFGAFHTSEVPYVFDNLRLLSRPWEEVDRGIAETMASYWANFAATGDPNGVGLPEWRPYRDDRDAVLVLGEEIGMRRLPAPERRAFFEARPEEAPRR